MPLFLLLYIVSAIIVIAAIFILSYNEKKMKTAKTILTIIFIVSVIGIIVATGFLEMRYGYSKLISSVIAAAILGLMYAADTLGGKLSLENEGE